MRPDALGFVEGVVVSDAEALVNAERDADSQPVPDGDIVVEVDAPPDADAKSVPDGDAPGLPDAMPDAENDGDPDTLALAAAEVVTCADAERVF